MHNYLSHEIGRWYIPINNNYQYHIGTKVINWYRVIVIIIKTGLLDYYTEKYIVIIIDPEDNTTFHCEFHPSINIFS